MIGKRVKWEAHHFTAGGRGTVATIEKPFRTRWAVIRMDDGREVSVELKRLQEVPDGVWAPRAVQARGHVAVGPGRCSCGCRFLAWGNPSPRALGKHIGRWMDRQKGDQNGVASAVH